MIILPIRTRLLKMKHKPDAIENAEEVIKKYEELGLSREDAIKSAEVGVGIFVDGVKLIYPGYLSLWQRTFNYLRSLTSPV